MLLAGCSLDSRSFITLSNAEVHVNPVPSGAVGKDCQRRLLSRPRFVRAVAPRIIIIIIIIIMPKLLDIEGISQLPRKQILTLTSIKKGM
jgi:hypothetical protein